MTTVSMDGRYACALQVDGHASCWGEFLGEGYVPMPDDLMLVKISVHWTHACGLRPDGTLVCWGQNEEGQQDLSIGPP